MFGMFLYFLTFSSFSFPPRPADEGMGSAAGTRRPLFSFRIFSGLPDVRIPALHQPPKYRPVFYKRFPNGSSPFQTGVRLSKRGVRLFELSSPIAFLNLYG